MSGLGLSKHVALGAERELGASLNFVDVLAPQFLSLTRASDASDARVGTVVASNVARSIQVGAGASHQVTIEDARTRVHSLDLTTWTESGNGSSVVTNLGGGIYRVAFTTTNIYLRQALFTSVNGAQYAGRIQVRLVSGDPNGAILKFCIRANPGGNFAQSNMQALTSNWTEFTCSGAAVSTSSRVGIVCESTTGGSVTIDVRLVQVEAGEYSSTLIPATVANGARPREDALANLASLTHMRSDTRLCILGDSYGGGAGDRPGLAGFIADAMGCDVRDLCVGGTTLEQQRDAYAAATAAHAEPLVICDGWSELSEAAWFAALADILATAQGPVYIIGPRGGTDAASIAATGVATHGANWLDLYGYAGLEYADGVHLTNGSLRRVAATARDAMLALGGFGALSAASGIRGPAGTLVVTAKPIGWSGTPNPASNYNIFLASPATGGTDYLHIRVQIGGGGSTDRIEAYRGDGVGQYVSRSVSSVPIGSSPLVFAAWWAGAGLRLYVISAADGVLRVSTHARQVNILGMIDMPSLEIGSGLSDFVKINSHLTAHYSPGVVDDDALEAFMRQQLAAVA